MTKAEQRERMANAKEYNKHYKSDVKTQCEMTIEYIEKYGSITPLEALNAFGSLRLGARISDLRRAGYNIKTDIAKGDKSFAIYSLDSI